MGNNYYKTEMIFLSTFLLLFASSFSIVSIIGNKKNSISLALVKKTKTNLKNKQIPKLHIVPITINTSNALCMDSAMINIYH